MPNKIKIVIPFAWPEIGRKNLGAAYNAAMEEAAAVDPAAWLCFLDYDAMLLAPEMYEVLTAYAGLAEKLNYGLLGAYTNRIGNSSQRDKTIDPDNHNILDHRRLARKYLAGRPGIHEITRATTKLSGLLMLTSVPAWKKAGGFTSGFFVDNAYHEAMRNAGLRVGLMNTVYVYHFYRGDGSLAHLPKDANGTPLMNRQGIQPARPDDCGCYKINDLTE